MSAKSAEVQPWQRPPFEPGNQLARRHGAYARVTRDELDPKVREIVDALSADAPIRDARGHLPAADEPAVELLADTMVRRERVAAEVDRNGWGGRGRGSLYEYDARLRSLSIELMRELGLTPKSRLAMGVDLARTVDLAQQWAAEGEDETLDGEATEDGDG